MPPASRTHGLLGAGPSSFLGASVSLSDRSPNAEKELNRSRGAVRGAGTPAHSSCGAESQKKNFVPPGCSIPVGTGDEGWGGCPLHTVCRRLSPVRGSCSAAEAVGDRATAWLLS